MRKNRSPGAPVSRPALQVFVAESMRSDEAGPRAALSRWQDVAGHHFELAGGAGHSIDAQQDFKMPERTGGRDAASAKGRGETCGIGDEVSRSLRAFAVQAGEKKNLPGLIGVGDRRDQGERIASGAAPCRGDI